MIAPDPRQGFDPVSGYSSVGARILHVKHWANGGETSLDNLVLVCPTHHRLVHEGGFDVRRLDDGAFRFTNPHGLTIRPPRGQGGR